MKMRMFPGCALGTALALATAFTAVADGPDAAPAPDRAPASPAVAPPTAKAASAVQISALPGGVDNARDSAPAALSAWSQEVQKLLRAGVDERVVLLYITNSAGLFNLTPDQVILLKNAGAPKQVLNAMIHHDKNLMAGVKASPESLAAAASQGSGAQPGEATRPDLAGGSILPAPGPASGPQIVAAEEGWENAPLDTENDYYAPEQPADFGPVRAPYAVKLNDPIVILKLPTFAVPYW